MQFRGISLNLSLQMQGLLPHPHLLIALMQSPAELCWCWRGFLIAWPTAQFPGPQWQIARQDQWRYFFLLPSCVAKSSLSFCHPHVNSSWPLSSVFLFVFMNTQRSLPLPLPGGRGRRDGVDCPLCCWGCSRADRGWKCWTETDGFSLEATL